MYKNCVTEESIQRQRRIEDCLLEKMRKSRYEAIKVSDLCGQAGVSRNTFYRYYDSKDDVLDALLDHTLMDSGVANPIGSAASPGPPPEIGALLRFWQRQKPLLDGLSRSNLEAKLVERVFRYVRVENPGILGRMGSTAAEGENEMLLFLTSGIMSVILNWHRGGFQKPAEQIAGVLSRLMFAPLFQQ